MALSIFLSFLLLLATAVDCNPARQGKKQSSSGPVTCPGFPGYCSESYPGDTCLVVCARGRNNVPECQDDGTWTAEPRCIEHEPGKQEQVPGVCPGIPGYCSLDLPGGLCTFQCSVGPAIRSTCTLDGTWNPYPTCEGDPRETQDGCNPCPGPLGAPRNRTAENGAGGSRANNIPSGGGSKPANKSLTGAAAGADKGNSASSSRNQGAATGGSSRNHGAATASSNSGSSRNQGAATGASNKNQGTKSNSSSGGSKNSHPAPSAVQQPSKGGSSNGSRGHGDIGKESSSACPGDVLQSCIDVCPGFSARVFAACVSGCAKRCPDK